MLLSGVYVYRKYCCSLSCMHTGSVAVTMHTYKVLEVHVSDMPNTESALVIQHSSKIQTELLLQFEIHTWYKKYAVLLLLQSGKQKRV